MPVFHDRDFDSLAAQVVDAYFSKSATLAAAAADVAKDQQMNPDQIERLTQAANTQTFLRMMEQAKMNGAEDLTEEFEPVDSRQVIRIVIDNTGIRVEPGNADPDSDADERACDVDDIPDEREKEAYALFPAVGAVKEGAEKEPRPLPAHEQARRTHKLAALLEDQLLQAGFVFDDTYAKLSDRFRKTARAVSFAEFEKDALTENGDDEVAVEILNGIRGARNLEPLSFRESAEKCASLRGYHVSIDSASLSLFDDLVKTAKHARRLEQGLDVLRSKCR